MINHSLCWRPVVRLTVLNSLCSTNSPSERLFHQQVIKFGIEEIKFHQKKVQKIMFIYINESLFSITYYMEINQEFFIYIAPVRSGHFKTDGPKDRSFQDCHPTLITGAACLDFINDLEPNLLDSFFFEKN
ncbi:hypothetical protein BpHYR1_032749 [Brachionus plicatilis]|uniref:Uncharacterized protein n=1 Tax=Brachionus plicatilis TaxID=10195 RepID=A0A3M7QYK4_BRAPC|nr:hypothetical protein BpHYR1_032749 [Brachionus plicatilis]